MLAVLSERLRSTVLSKVCGPDTPRCSKDKTHLKESYAELGKLLSEEQCLMLIQLFTHARRQMRDAAQTRLPLEVALIRAARARELIDLSKLASALESGAGKSPGAQGVAPPNSTGRPPPSEGARPNWEGRPATDNAKPAAAPIIPGAPAAASNLRDAWPRVIDAIKTQKGGAVIASSLAHSAVAFDAERGEIALATDSEFYRNALNQPQNQQALKGVLTGIYGREWNIRVTDTASQQAAAPIRKSASGVASTSAPPNAPSSARSGSASSGAAQQAEAQRAALPAAVPLAKTTPTIPAARPVSPAAAAPASTDDQWEPRDESL